MAWRWRLDAFALVLPHPGSVVPGGSYTDVHVRLPILRAFTLLALAAAALCAYAAVRPVRPRRLAVPVAAIALLAAAITGLPGLIERFDVAPQALARERPYVADAIAATRRAFALDDVDVREARQPASSPAGTLAEHRDTVENVPLWDSSVLRAAMNETQSIGGYYSFPSTTVDRYGDRLMTLAARRLELKHLSRAARSWANTHFAYTHGYGVVAVQGGEADADRYPRFAQREFGGEANPLGADAAAHLLRRARARATRRTWSSPATAPRSSSPRPARERPRTTTTARAGSRCRASPAGSRSRCASATSSCC